MKFKLLGKIFLSFVLSTLLISCHSQNIEKKLPTITNAQYKIYDIKGERGYHISFDLDYAEIEPVGIVLNSLEQEITLENNTTDNHYKINLIAESPAISSIRPKKSKFENGIIFKVEQTYYFKPVKFTRQ